MDVVRSEVEYKMSVICVRVMAIYIARINKGINKDKSKEE
jgi:hypothetical protein